jgi:hypothetical protein
LFWLCVPAGNGADICADGARPSPQKTELPQKIPVKSNLLVLLPMGMAAFFEKSHKNEKRIQKERNQNGTRTEPEQKQNTQVA